MTRGVFHIIKFIYKGKDPDNISISVILKFPPHIEVENYLISMYKLSISVYLNIFQSKCNLLCYFRLLSVTILSGFYTDVFLKIF